MSTTVDSGRVLLETKLRPPDIRAQTVPRRRLTGDLGRVPLTLVGAPAGWGKTTLLAEWAADRGRVAWVALDRGDNDPVVFFTYLVEALRTAVPGIGASAVAALATPGAGMVDAGLTVLVNDLMALPEPVTLVLDDYHLITDRAVHDGMAFLLAHLPTTLRLVISTRADPPLPLARLRARGELGEVRADQLRFDAGEAGSLVNDVLGLSLAPAALGRLHERTEGWAAGLCLAVLSLRGRPDPAAFIDDFAGDDRHIVDYLGAEVIAGQSPEVRDFLLRTSVLDRMCGPLCDAVTGETGGARRLETIEAADLFVVPLDTRREWYRYHHLFADLLRYELSRSAPELVPELHRRAGAWCREAGFVDEAVRHTVAAGDVPGAVDLILGHFLERVAQGRGATILAWLDALPAGVVPGDARLCLARALALFNLRRHEEVGAWLDRAEQAPVGGPVMDGTASLEASLTIARSFLPYLTGNLAGSVEVTRRALALEGASWWGTCMRAALGRYLYLAGEAGAGLDHLRAVLSEVEAPGNEMLAASALGVLAAAAADDGDGDPGGGAAHAFLARLHGVVGRSPLLGEHHVIALPTAVEGRLLLSAGRAAEADATTARAVELAERGASPIDLAACLVARAEVRAALGDHDAPPALLAAARQVLAGCADPGPVVTGYLCRAERDLRLPAPPGRPGAGPPERPAELDGEGLSERELAVLRLLAGPLSLREVGDALYVSLNTVKTHARGVYRKLGVGSRQEAVARARRLGLI